jgi:excisionase family DNA binding protein
MTRELPGAGTSRAELPALLSVPQAARLLGLTRSAAYRCAASGELPTQRLGGRVYVITAAIRPLLDGTGKLAA